MSISEDPLQLSHDIKNKNIPFQKYTTYLVLDSFEKNESASDNNRGYYKYNLDNISKKTSDNKIGLGHHLKNITEICIMEFALPMLPILNRPIDYNLKLPFLKDYVQIDSFTDVNYGGASASGTGDNFIENKATQLINMGRVFIGIKELQSQSVSNFKGFQHVEFDTYLKLYPYPHLFCKPLEGFEIIKLHTPIKSLETLTLCFSNPDVHLILPKDVIEVTPKLRNIGDDPDDTLATLRLYLDFNESLENEILLTPGDKVFFKNFNSKEKKTLFNEKKLNTYVPFLDKYMNNKNGIYIDISNGLVYPSPNIDFQSFTGAIPDYNVVVPGWLDSSNNQLYYLPTDSTDANDQNYNQLEKKFKIFIPRNRIRIPIKITGIKTYNRYLAYKIIE